MKRFLASAAMIFTLSACASALESATQDVTVLTPGAHESVCYLDNGALKYRAWPPETIRMSKRPGELTVHCVADGNREQTVVIPVDHQDMVLANAANGFLPGMLVDYHTGAMFAYPDKVIVDFSDIPPQPQPRPAYDHFLKENPDLFGMEEFRPGDAALMRDKYREPIELEKRDFSGTGLFGAEATGTATDGADGAAELGGIDKDAPPLNMPPSDMISDLTKQMNPRVFGPSPSAQDSQDSGFVGGTATTNDSDGSSADNGPVTIYPLEN